MGIQLTEKDRKGAVARCEKEWKDPGFRERNRLQCKKMSLDPVIREKSQKTSLERYGSINCWTGKKHKLETIEKMRESHLGKQSGSKNSQFGKRWMHLESNSKPVPKELIQEYLNLGWEFGRKMRMNESRIDALEHGA